MMIGLMALAFLVFLAPARAQDARDLARISAYLNAMTTVTGDFVQVAPNGAVSDGKFYISRPGRIRFEYAPPNPTLVVSDGTWVVVFDTRDCTQQTAPLSQTPLNLILKDRVNLREEGAVTGVESKDGQMRVTAIDPGNPDQGSITMVFSETPLELRQWTITDAEGQTTTVALSELRRGVDVSIAKFLPREIMLEQCKSQF
ncbi:MAG: outer membrane lipoprotein-sorting protein [Paracoccaceae bacterium]|jgi:outer membrane lipoprotein-sorting protein